MRTCPTRALEVILGLPPLYLVIGEAKQKTLARFCRQGFGPDAIIGTKHRDQVCRYLPILAMPMDETIKRYQFDKKFDTQLSSKANWKSVGANYNIGKNSIIWYTDGSKTKEGTGSGVFGPRTKYSEPLGEYPSIFQAEMHAIERCASINLEKEQVGREIAILSDSQAAIRALSSYTFTSKLAWDCNTRLNELGSRNKVTIYWVPGHKDIYGNEMADELARRGSCTPLTGPAPFCGVNSSTIDKILKDIYIEEWKTEWANTPGCRQSKLLLGQYNQKRSEECLRLPRNRLRILTGFLTGHCRLRKHLKNIGIVDEDHCRFCVTEVETPEHLLTNCRAIFARRRRALGHYTLKKGQLKSLTTLSILDFIEKCGLTETL